MRKILHISDLHFPCITPGAAAALRQRAQDLQVDLVVISGDLTQRGREWQYRQAAGFLAQMPRPQLVIPGNHDVPLFDLYRRFFRPAERFTRLICADLQPVYQDPQMLVVGVTSTRPITADWRGFWKNGSLSDAQLEQLRRQFAQPSPCKVLVMHHPLVNPWDETTRDCIRRRQDILPVLQECGVNVVLSGHLHHACVRTVPAAAGGAPIVSIQCGTSTSTRLRDEPDSFNLITLTGRESQVQVYRWDGKGYEAADLPVG